MAVATSSKGLPADLIMGAAKMKPLLALSKREPVQAAMALTSAGEGILLLDKKAQPKKVAALLRAAASKEKVELNSSSVRFGRAEVDTDLDPGLIRFTINKAPPGPMRIKLLEVVKRIPFQKVELVVDPSLEEEMPEGGDVSAPAPSAAALETEAPNLKAALAGLIGEVAKQPNDGSGRRAALLGLANEAILKVKAGDANAAASIQALRKALETPAAAVDPVIDDALLTIETIRANLTGLARRIPEAAGSDPARRAGMTGFAAEAQEYLKAAALEAAAYSTTVLRDTIEAKPAAPLLPVWTAAKDKVDAQLSDFYGLLKKSGVPALEVVAEEVQAVLAGFRVPMFKALMAYDAAPEARRASARQAALNVIKDYRVRLPRDRFVVGAETNPFGIPITIQQTLGAALDELSRRLDA